MPNQEIYTASKKHDDLYHGIRHMGPLAQGIGMDNIAKDVLGVEPPDIRASGEAVTIGLCDETTFLRAFFASYASRKQRNEINVPPELRTTITFSRWIQKKLGEDVANIEYIDHLEVPYVKPRPNGIVLGTGHDASPVLDYRIVTSSKRPDSVRGGITFGVLWTPDDVSKRRKEDISEDDITDCVILEVERNWGDTRFSVIESVDTDTDFEMIIGKESIKRADMQYFAAANKARDNDSLSLHQVAAERKMPIK